MQLCYERITQWIWLKLFGNLKMAAGTRYNLRDRGIIFQGATVTQFAEMFNMKRQIVERRLSGCPKAGIVNGTALYHIKDAAPLLIRVKLTDEMVYETLKRADPKDFPAFTNKMFWEGMGVRRKYEEQVGDLWHSSDVAAVASASFNAIRMSLLLLPDELTDTAGLNERQRGIVQGIIDNALEGCRVALIDELRKPSRSGPEPSPEEGEI
jgi:hypothetical protein